MSFAEAYHDFAMLIQVTPPGREAEWHNLLKKATPAPEMCVEIRSPNLVIFAIGADTEMDALDRAEEWLLGLVAKVNPPISLSFDAHSSGRY